MSQTDNDDFDFQIVDNKKSLNVKQYKSYNSNVVLITKDKLQLKLNYYKLNNIVYVNVNGEHLFDFKILLLIDWTSNINNDDTTHLCIKHSKLGEIIIKNCNVEMFQKGLHVINEWVNKNKNFFKDLYGYF
jgi:hypothetical protein